MFGGWGHAEWFMVALCLATAVYWFYDALRALTQKRRDRLHCQAILKRVIEGVPLPARHVVGLLAPRLEEIYLGEVFRNYIAGLPLSRKRAILDTLLANAARRTRKDDIPSMIDSMNEAELETLGQIVLEGNRYPSMLVAKGEMANAVILFVMQHPHVNPPMPVTP